ncbi:MULTISPECIES: urate hydroxylase PuuD [unclassified Lysobacter]|uniref:urate hydroxylase PuuD n=1 Tax=unclassified Lysobacter TaxID=2635362 RepID=UPI001BE7A733|nr:MULTISPECIES: urate hydroxylase PuuD [unclassified Lysobacter]MBT2748727.1 urate hydroxylase PuuD [Lysobacter sp. ISL-42]MBT2751662.1 urate hydroxylase PuuD [Lysobacter sp. ISL-50]MBT2775856.1 urate hydroxylase PuuD [Lysobacter sp. ISL-54]MBT2782180.1 urate hydroxylase PuuD [Lysobacter sp. ISL-52]
MTGTLLDLAADAIRWLHVLAAFAWLGAGLWIRRLTLRARPLLDQRSELEVWDTHSLSFWRTEKVAAPAAAELDGLVWSFNQIRWLVGTGVVLFCLIYYRQPLAYLVDPSIARLSAREAIAASILGLTGAPVVNELVNRIPLHYNTLYMTASVAHVLGWAWLYANLFSQHGAMIQIGAMMGMVIAFNVLWFLYPRMRKAFNAALRGEKPDAVDKQHWDRRGLHSYITMAVVFLMLSGHMGSLVRANGHPFLTIATVLALSVAARWALDATHRNGGVMPMEIRWISAIAIVALGLMLTWMALPRTPAEQVAALARTHVSAGGAALPPKPSSANSIPSPAATGEAPLRADAIVQRRCAVCHAARPSFPGVASPPRGIVFTSETLPLYAGLIAAVVQSERMPPGNATDMQPDERKAVTQWATDHAR